MTIQILLIAHIVLGAIALIAGGVAAFSKKGNNFHRKSGKIFAVSMLLCALAAIALSTLKPNPFLFGIGLFTIYLVGSGWIWSFRTRQKLKESVAKYIGIFGLFAAAYLLFISFSGNGVNVVSAVFGSLMLVLSSTDIFRKLPPHKNMARHGGRMGGAYIAAFTAFLVVNIDFLPPLMVWLLPTAIGTPLIIIGIGRWESRAGARKTKTL